MYKPTVLATTMLTMFATIIYKSSCKVHNVHKFNYTLHP